MGGVLLLVMLPAEAAHCTTYSTSTTDLDERTIIVDIGQIFDPGARFYFFYDACHPNCLFSFGIYEESNGIPGLQRYDGGADDTCHLAIMPDLWY